MTTPIPESALHLLRLSLDNPNATFHEGQWESIFKIVYEKAQLLVVQRTGWGKSLVYFLATRLLRHQGHGPTLIISPLLALMRNQADAAQRLGVRAEALHSANTGHWKRIQQDILDNRVDLLLISPERLANPTFREKILKPLSHRIGLFVVDEAHCISDWGHDFRPDYRQIGRILRDMPYNMPILATTATANDRVVEDIIKQLGPHLTLMRGPLMRPSLRLENITLPLASERMAWLATVLPNIPGSGILYTLSIKDAQRLAAWLQINGIDAQAYWGGLDNTHRIHLEQRLLNNDVKVLVSTNALGMGFDKPDLGFVIHYQKPNSVVDYYQQVGRAGRAIQRAYGFLLAGKEDDTIAEFLLDKVFLPQTHIQKLLSILQTLERGASLSLLESRLNLKRSHIENILKILSTENPSPVIQEGHLWYATPVLYYADEEKIETLKKIRRHEQLRVRAYVESKTCLMVFLAKELDDETTKKCGRCAPCRGRPFAPHTYSPELAHKAVLFLQHSSYPLVPKLKWPSHALPGYGFKGPILPQHQMQEGRSLSQWDDNGWGSLVKKDKQENGFFRELLLDAMVSLIQNRWKPTPAPLWVCCVPSLNHPKLVPTFAKELAKKLNLPFVNCIQKIKKTDPQKEMSNSYKQANNLDDSFKIRTFSVLSKPVLLVDDVMDSGWTLTLLAALLRESGSGPVFPVTLATATTS